MSTIEAGKTYDITVRRVATVTSGTRVAWEGADGGIYAAYLDSDTVTVTEVVVEPPVGSIVCDKDGDYLVRDSKGWRYLYERRLGSERWTWEELSSPGDEDGDLFPVTVVYEAGK